MKRFLFFVGLSLLVISCAPPSYRGKRIPPAPGRIAYPPPKSAFLYEEGKEAFQKGKTILALEKLDRFVKQNPSSDLTDNALFLMGRIFLKRENPYEALRYFQKIEKDFSGSDTIGEALYGQAYCWYKLKDFKRAGEPLKRLFAFSHLPDSLFIRAETLKGHLCVLEKQVRCGIQAYLSAKDRTTNPTEQAVLDTFIEKVVLEVRNTATLKNIMDVHPEDIAGDTARLRLAEILILQKDFKGAKELLSTSFLKRLPDILRQKAEELLTKLQRAFIRKVVIGCLLPLSGTRAPFGMRALKGVLLAVNAFQTHPEKLDITLMVRDTKGKPEMAAKMARDLVETCHARAIVGPMFLDTTKAAMEQLQSFPVPLISLSQAEGIPELGSFVFRNCLTPTQQIQALVRYLTETLDLHTAAILYPQSPLGQRYMKLFWERFEEMGGEIRGVESYLPTDTDFGTPIKKLVGLYYTKERWERGDTPNEEGKFPPVIDFEALFIPDIYSRVVLIAPQLAFYDVVGITLAGINTWNAPDLIKEGKRFVRGAVFTDGFFPKSKAAAVGKFVSDFEAAYDEKPEILAAQAFDATRLLVRAFKQTPVGDVEKLEEALKHDSGYRGVSGLRYFDENGEAIRDVMVLTVAHGKIIPAPVSSTSTPSSP